MIRNRLKREPIMLQRPLQRLSNGVETEGQVAFQETLAEIHIEFTFQCISRDTEAGL